MIEPAPDPIHHEHRGLIPRPAPMTAAETERALVDRVYGALRKVWDPELGIDIVSLGLVYGVRVGDNGIEVDMTLTTPGCPVSESLPDEADYALSWAIPEMPHRVEVVWEPPWTPDRLSDEASRSLGLGRSGTA